MNVIHSTVNDLKQRGIITDYVSFYPCQCATCGIPFYIPQKYKEKLEKHGQTFHCPNGHSLWFGKSRVEELEEELAQQKNNYENMKRYKDGIIEDKNNQIKVAKAKKTRMENKIKAGLCPFCTGKHRHFDNLQSHIETKHPDQVKPKRKVPKVRNK
jgi:hypothetical protein